VSKDTPLPCMLVTSVVLVTTGRLGGAPTGGRGGVSRPMYLFSMVPEGYTRVPWASGPLSRPRCHGKKGGEEEGAHGLQEALLASYAGEGREVYRGGVPREVYHG